MKDQYFGDINDYRKYGLLRAIQDATGLRSGVCWLRTGADDRRDGEFRSYLQQPSKWRRYDPELYDHLRALLREDTERATLQAEAWDLVPGAIYQHEMIVDDGSARATYFTATWEFFHGIPLLFFDPDNGIEVSSVSWGRQNSSKYVFWRELEEAAARGHSLLVYQHFPRKPREAFIVELAAALLSRLHASQVQVFRTAHVAFLLIPQESHLAAFGRLPALVSDRWSSQFQVSVHHVA
jgi:hypothetical protein